MKSGTVASGASGRTAKASKPLSMGTHENGPVLTKHSQPINVEKPTASNGTDGWLRLELPFVMEPDRACRIMLGNGDFPGPLAAEIETIEAVDHYTAQAEDFANAVRQGKPLEYPLENAVANMAVIDAVFRSAETGRWEDV